MIQKEKKPGDNVIIRLKSREKQETLDWLNAQTNIAESVRFLIELDTLVNGIRNYSELIPTERSEKFLLNYLAKELSRKQENLKVYNSFVPVETQGNNIPIVHSEEQNISTFPVKMKNVPEEGIHSTEADITDISSVDLGMEYGEQSSSISQDTLSEVEKDSHTDVIKRTAVVRVQTDTIEREQLLTKDVEDENDTELDKNNVVKETEPIENLKSLIVPEKRKKKKEFKLSEEERVSWS